MSRLIVKNLPSYATPAQLSNHFQQKGGPGGTITDVKVALKPDGTSRRFGFVGYKTEQEAQKAKEWYDKTFLDSSRLSVAIVDGAKDAPTPRPNKRPRLGPSPSDESQPTSAKSPGGKLANSKKSTSKGDGQLDEFMKVMQPRTKPGRTWVNEDADSQLNQPSALNAKEGRVKKSMKEKKERKEDEATEVKAVNDGEEGGDQKEEGISDLDWMRRRMKDAADPGLETETEKAFEQSDEEEEEEVNEETAETEAEQSPKDPNKTTILETARLFLRNLAFSCTEDELSELFRPYGEVSQVHIPLDPQTKQSKGMAYVTFTQPSCALAAYEALDKRSFQGRLLHILAAVNRKGKVEVEEHGGKNSVKDVKDEKRKAMAGKEFNWSMLYMNSDAVVSSIADRMNVSKADILNPESDNAAVKLALAETHVIQETKTYLEQQGVILESFSSRARSDTIILVKNIPYGTTAEQIKDMFDPHGELSRVLVPPAGTMAVVEYVHADDARKGFKAVAYRRLGNSIIYLEKGPLGMFKAPPEERPARAPILSTSVKPVKIADEAEEREEPPTTTSLGAGTTLFVKNLSFASTSERLTQVFRNLDSFAFARVQTKPDSKHPGPDGPRLSMGYGFVGFKTPEGAKKALKGMQGFVLDGHALSVKFAGRGAEEQKEKSEAKATSTKMLVKNVPFEATKKDIRQLFGAHGQLKSVRLPKRFDHRARGFAFLEFVTRHEAENAYNALRHTHLLGRHLVLEWAEEGEMDVDALRKKAGVGFGDGKDVPGRKRKLQMDGEDVDVAEEDE